MFQLNSSDPQCTEQLGVCLGECLRAGDLVRLHGELGAGKTTFCRGVGQGLSVSEGLSSPTYLLCKEYATQAGPLLHLDGYFEHRLASLLGEGLVERIDGRSIVLVEWAERVDPWLPKGGLGLDFQRMLGDSSPSEDDDLPRRIECTAQGSAARDLARRFSEKLAEKGISVEPSAGPTR
jgi:tRNA threonylcarbamoyladenosine biosynthesis protein TsaE